jgi:LPXTG-site transpeptidase (sortase) family protein
VRRYLRPLLLTVLGLALLVGSPLVWWLSQPEVTVGEVVPATEQSTMTMRQQPDPEPASAPLPDPVAGEPERLVVPAIDVDHPVIPVGLETDGAMEIPGRVDEIGWYTGTHVRPGDPGSAVLAGHVDSRTQGRGAFFDLGRLDVGDDIHLETEAGEQRWQVTGRTSYDKTYLPIDDIFTVSGEPRLVLITCGGPFDSATRHYTENVVVYAELLDG